MIRPGTLSAQPLPQEPERMSGWAEMGMRKCLRMGLRQVGQVGGQERLGGQDSTKARRVDTVGSCSRAQPHLSLPNDHIPVFSSLQDSEKHVPLQLVKHL